MRYKELDGLRGLAALNVFFFHAVGMFNLAANNTAYHMFWDGGAAVTLFFVLSGFVLALPYVRGKELDLVPFYIQRVFRIYPAYLTAIAFSLVLKTYLYQTGVLQDLSPMTTQLWTTSYTPMESIFNHLLLIGPSFDTHDIDPVIWTLVMEMKISIIYPVVILLLRSIHTPLAAIALFVLSMVTFLIVGGATYYLPLFVIGGLAAKFHQQITRALSSLPSPFVAILAVAGFTLYTSTYSLPWLTVHNYFAQIIVGIGAAIIMILALTFFRFSTFLKSRPVAFLGDVSYSLYLLHFPVLFTVTSVLYPLFKSPLTWLTWPITLAITLALSHLSTKHIEQKFQVVGRTLADKTRDLYIGKSTIR